MQIKYKIQHKNLWDTPSSVFEWWYVAKEEKCFCRQWCMKWTLRPSKHIQKNWNKYNHLMMKEIRLRGWVWRCAPSHPLRFPSRRSCSRRKRHSVALPMSFDRNVTNALISTDKEFDENAHSSTPYRFNWMQILLIHLCLNTFDHINNLKHLKGKWKN